MRRSTKTQRILQAVARWLVLAAVILSPWFFGSADPWAYLLICAIVELGMITWLSSCFAVPHVTFHFRLAGIVLILLAGYVALQMAPLPAAAIKVMNPLAYDVSAQAKDVLAEVGVDEFFADNERGIGVLPSLSLSRGASQRAFYLVVVYLGAFFVVLNTFRHWHQLRHAAVAIVGAGFVMTVLALIHNFSGSDEIFWFHSPRYGGNIFGPFTNRNHFAAHANMIFGLAFGLFLSSRHFRDMIVSRQWRERLAWLSTKRASQMALSGLAVMLLVGAVCVSMSRGAMLSLAAALGVFGGIVAFRQRSVPRARSAILAIALLVLGAAVWLGGQEMLARISSLKEIVKNPLSDYRTIVTLETLKMFKACPLTGVGFGAFRHVFTVFQGPSLQFRWLHAHNDWVQLLAEGGLLGAGLFFTAVILLVKGILREYRTARHRAKLFTIGAAIGLGTIAVHSLVDYGLHKPANALLLAVLAGLAGAAVFLKHEPRLPRVPSAPAQEGDNDPGGQPEAGWPGIKINLVRIAALSVIVMLTLLLVLQFREFRGELAFTRFLYLQRQAEIIDDPGELKKIVGNAFRESEIIMAWGGNNPDALTEAAGGLILLEFNMKLDRSDRVRAAEKATECATLAVTRAPSDYLPWLMLARSQTTMARWDEAELCLERSRLLTRHQREVRMFDVAEMEEDMQIP